MSCGHEALQVLDRLYGSVEDEICGLTVITFGESHERSHFYRSFEDFPFNDYPIHNIPDIGHEHPGPVFRDPAAPGHLGNSVFERGSQVPGGCQTINHQAPFYTNERPADLYGMRPAWISGYGYGQPQAGYLDYGMGVLSFPPCGELDELYQVSGPR